MDRKSKDYFYEHTGVAMVRDTVNHMKRFYENVADVVFLPGYVFSPISREAVNLLGKYVDMCISKKEWIESPDDEKAFKELVKRGFFKKTLF